jgi:hypothetical protein
VFERRVRVNAAGVPVTVVRKVNLLLWLPAIIDGGSVSETVKVLV